MAPWPFDPTGETGCLQGFGTFGRSRQTRYTIIVKPVPFVTVGVRQEFEVRCTAPPEEECELSRAEYTKTSGGND